MIKFTYNKELMKFIVILTLILISILPTWGQPKRVQKNSIGIATLTGQQLYKGNQNEFFPIPAISYSNQNFYFRGLTLGYKLLPPPFSFEVVLSPNMQHLRDEGDQISDGIIERKRTLQAGLVFSLPTPWFMITNSITTDLLNRHQSIIFQLSLMKRFIAFSSWVIMPSVQFNVLSEKYIDYYYQVSSSEIKNERAYFNPNKGGIEPSVSMMNIFEINEKINLLVRPSMTWLPNSAQKSPLIENSSRWQLLLSLNYNLN